MEVVYAGGGRDEGKRRSNHCFLRGANFGTGPTATAFRNHESVRGSGSNGILLTDTRERERENPHGVCVSEHLRSRGIVVDSRCRDLARIHVSCAYRAEYSSEFVSTGMNMLPPSLSLSPSISVEWDDVSRDISMRARARFAVRDTTLLDTYTRCCSVFFSASFQRRSPNFPKSLCIPLLPQPAYLLRWGKFAQWPSTSKGVVPGDEQWQSRSRRCRSSTDRTDIRYR